MAKYTGPVMKKCRALGINPADLGISRKSTKQVKYRRKKQSDYAMQLKEKQKVKFVYGVEKQKVKFVYGVLEKQFKGYYEKASKMRGVTGENMLILLERRLDNVVYRLGLGKTRAMARQLVNHGHITVNGKRVDIPSYLVEAGDVIAVKENKKNLPIWQAAKEVKNLSIVKWLEWDNNELSGKVLSLPERADIVDVEIKEHLIIELYSK